MRPPFRKCKIVFPADTSLVDRVQFCMNTTEQPTTEPVMPTISIAQGTDEAEKRIQEVLKDMQMSEVDKFFVVAAVRAAYSQGYFEGCWQSGRR